MNLNLKLRQSYRVFRKQIRALLKLAVKVARSEGHEICGLLLSNGYCLDFVLTKNKTTRPGAFSFHSREAVRIERAAACLKHRVVGTFHSHPASSAKPGENDIKFAEDDSLMLIISCFDKEAKLWHIYKGNAYPVILDYI